MIEIDCADAAELFEETLGRLVTLAAFVERTAFGDFITKVTVRGAGHINDRVAVLA